MNTNRPNHKSNGARRADAAHSAGRSRREAYKAAYRRYTADGYSQTEAAAKAKTDAYGDRPDPYGPKNTD